LVTELGDCLELGNWDLPRATFPTTKAGKTRLFCHDFDPIERLA
jgi:hypothetical protein